MKSNSLAIKIVCGAVVLASFLGTRLHAADGGEQANIAPAKVEPSQVAARPQGLSDLAPVDPDALAGDVAKPLIEGVMALDKSGTGEVKLLELIKRLRPYGYGIVSEAAPTAQGGRRGGRGGRGGGPSGAGSRGGSGGGASGGNRGAPADDTQLRARFDSFDRDRDGVWKGDEINAYMSSHPDSGDGQVTFDEYKKAWEELRSGRGGQGGRGGSGRHGGGGHGGGGGGHGHGGGAVTVAARASEDAKFITTLDVDRNRLITVDEIRKAVAADVAKQLNPEPESAEGETGGAKQSESAQPISPRMQQRLGRRLVARSQAIRAVLLISDANKPADKVDAKLFDGHVKESDARDQLWKSIAGEASSIETKSVYPGLVRVESELLGKIQP